MKTAAPPRVAEWGSDWKNHVARLCNVVDLTGAEEDYPLAIGETARINISAASTLLHIAVEDGVYDIDGIFDEASFAADQVINLNANNTTYANEFRAVRISADTSFATDEVDTGESTTLAAHALSGNSAVKPRHFNGRLIISGVLSNMTITMMCTSAGSQRLSVTTSSWPVSVAHSSLGTLSIVEPATGVIYVRRVG